MNDVRPILGISKNRFRGQKELSIAALLPDVLDELRLSRENSYSLNFNKNGKQIIDWTNWQRAYDQDRRRQKPRAAGVLMTMRRDVLDRHIEGLDYQLCFEIKVKRTADKYKPESQMNWQYFHRVI